MEQAIEIGQRLLGGDAAIGLREFHMINLGGEGSEAPFVGHHLARQPHGHVGPAMKSAGERHHGGTLGVISGNLDRILHRLRAGVQKEGFLGEVAGGERIQPLGEPKV